MLFGLFRDPEPQVEREMTDDELRAAAAVLRGDFDRGFAKVKARTGIYLDDAEILKDVPIIDMPGVFLPPHQLLDAYEKVRPGFRELTMSEMHRERALRYQKEFGDILGEADKTVCGLDRFAVGKAPLWRRAAARLTARWLRRSTIRTAEEMRNAER